MGPGSPFEGALAAFLEAAPDAIVVVDLDGKILAVNGLTGKLFGYAREELIGRPIETLVPERERAAHVKQRTEYSADPKTRPMGEGRELSGRRKDGSEFPVEISLSPLEVEKGKVVVSIVRDISRRHEAEALFRGLLESAPDGIIVVDAAGRITIVNGQAEKMFGYARTDLIGHAVEILVPLRYRGSHVGDRSAYAAAPRTRPMGAGRELMGLRKNGTEFPVEISLSPLETGEGRLVTTIIRDITERQEADRRRQTAETQAEQERLRAQHAEDAVKHRDEFLAIASHELRTPLTALQLQLQSLGSRLDDLDTKVTSKLERATRSAERLAALVDTLLDVSRISGGRLEIRTARFLLEDVVREVADRHRTQAAGAGCDLHLEFEPGLVGSWDRIRVEQVVTNLLSNAFKYGGGRPVEIRTRSTGEDVEIAVVDHGPGIAMEDAERIFERFERASPMQHYGGLGLGLYISRQIVTAHGGTIRVLHPPEGGAAFVVRLPRDAAASLASHDELKETPA